MSRSSFFCLPFFCLLLGTAATETVRADHKIGDLCRIKGQEENILHGVGLVGGLKGTGDADSKATQRALARYMELMGHRLGTDAKGKESFDDLKSVKNVALVFVSATVPAGGAQQGDLLDSPPPQPATAAPSRAGARCPACR